MIEWPAFLIESHIPATVTAARRRSEPAAGGVRTDAGPRTIRSPRCQGSGQWHRLRAGAAIARSVAGHRRRATRCSYLGAVWWFRRKGLLGGVELPQRSFAKICPGWAAVLRSRQHSDARDHVNRRRRSAPRAHLLRNGDRETHQDQSDLSVSSVRLVDGLPVRITVAARASLSGDGAITRWKR